MSRHHELRMVEIVERAHPRRIARHADEWLRCAIVLEDAAQQIDAITARQSEVGGRTGPSMAAATALTADVLRVKARDLRRGGEALMDVADSAAAHQEEKRRLDRDQPDDGYHAEWREEGARLVADGQEAALLRGIAVMRSIDVGEDPRRQPIEVVGPGPVDVPPPSWWPPREHRPDPPLDLEVDPDDDVLATPQGPTAGTAPVPGMGTGGAPGVASYAAGTPAAPAPGSLAGAAVLGTVGAAAGVRVASGGAAPASGVRGIGAGKSTSSGGVLGRSGSGVVAGAGGAGGAGGRGGRPGATGATGAATTGARGGRRKRDREAGPDRDLHDDGDGWLDDEAGPGVLR